MEPEPSAGVMIELAGSPSPDAAQGPVVELMGDRLDFQDEGGSLPQRVQPARVQGGLQIIFIGRIGRIGRMELRALDFVGMFAGGMAAGRRGRSSPRGSRLRQGYGAARRRGKSPRQGSG